MPLADAPVLLIPGHYDPVKDLPLTDSLHGTTDSAGTYRIRHVKIGTYNVLGVDRLSNDKVLITDVRVAGDDTTHLLTRMVAAPGNLKINVPASLAQSGSYIYLPGTPYFATVVNGTAVFSGVPAGFIPSAILASTLDVSRSVVVQTDMAVSPGDTATYAFYGSWKSSKKLFLNTTASGAGVAGTVTSFPVLVRLSAANFDFSQAQGRGEDLRFAKPDNTPLAYEIEKWDSANASAAVWVKIDTIIGNSDSRWIVMYWGASAADVPASLSSGPAVFDTAHGYQAVWHLGAASNGMAIDASANKFDGTPSATPPVPVKGVVGDAHEFNGSSTFFTMKNTASGALDFPYQGTYSISAWAYTNVLDSAYHTIVGKGAFGYNLEIHKFNTWQCADYKNMAGWEIAMAPASVNEWVYLTSVRNGASMQLYVNGVLADSTIDLVPRDSVPRNNPQDITVGKIIWPANEETPYFYDGGIDEVRIANVPLSADWIKLCYMNQKQDDKLVIFK
jgi:hypothetical protein